MNELLDRSWEIFNKAMTEHPPYAIVMMLSGGDDSLTAYHVARQLGIKVDFVLHGITGTGITDTTDFVRQLVSQGGTRYIEANAGKAFEDYVLRKGFFGIGNQAHEYAYHILKHQRFRSILSKHICQNRGGRTILLLNGARKQESANRKRSMLEPIKKDGAAPNYWVNIINDWSKLDCVNLLSDYKRNPVVELVHRSGECLCGTMQYPYQETRQEISYWFPKWGAWVDNLEKAACDRGFCWGWGEDLPPAVKAEKKRQKAIKNGQTHFLPMCQTCQFLQEQAR